MALPRTLDCADVKVTICGIELRSFQPGDVIIIDDPWEEPITKRQKWRQRWWDFRWRMKFRKRRMRSVKPITIWSQPG